MSASSCDSSSRASSRLMSPRSTFLMRLAASPSSPRTAQHHALRFQSEPSGSLCACSPFRFLNSGSLARLAARRSSNVSIKIYLRDLLRRVSRIAPPANQIRKKGQIVATAITIDIATTTMIAARNVAILSSFTLTMCQPARNDRNAITESRYQIIPVLSETSIPGRPCLRRDLP